MFAFLKASAVTYRWPVYLDLLKRLLASDVNILSTSDRRSKSSKIQSSIKLYLKRIQEYETMLETERQDFERGRRYLAQIMGEDPATFTQEKIDESIKYLFPSNLFCLKARPKLKPPEDVFPKERRLQCDPDGRPLHTLFYTQHPNFYSVMHEAVYQLEDMKNEYDGIFTGFTSQSKSRAPISLLSTEWFTKAELEEAISESVTDDQYEQWLLLMNRLAAHPFANLGKEFILRFRSNATKTVREETYPEPELDPVTHRRYMRSFGQKKNAFAEATVYMPGTGKITVNDKHMLEVFPNLGDREQIMSPLQLTKTLGQVDITAKVTGDGSSSPANALRLAISRCLASLLPEDVGKNRLRVAGLLQQDNRFGEKKKPGQPKARKKPIWKAR
ncbi:unnamed protein product [Calicophoron daubneyi]|uniref:Mitochondrial ribosomal protein S9 n=1 Tax=Calicophoron daubneyi TaxID=300641 RepID=A0AAV2TAI9_CALDB